MRLGALEDVERSEGEEIGLRLFVGTRSASVSSSDLSRDALAALVERAIAMAREAPEEARTATSGLYLVEVSPALALPSLAPEFFGRRAASRYDPGRRRTFRPANWGRVAQAAAARLDDLGLPEPAGWPP